jgi:hypothetical protein
MKKNPSNKVGKGKATITVRGIYVSNRPISSFPDQNTIELWDGQPSKPDEFHSMLKKVSRKTSRPVVERT